MVQLENRLPVRLVRQEQALRRRPVGPSSERSALGLMVLEVSDRVLARLEPRAGPAVLPRLAEQRRQVLRLAERAALPRLAEQRLELELRPAEREAELAALPRLEEALPLAQLALGQLLAVERVPKSALRRRGLRRPAPVRLGQLGVHERPQRGSFEANR